MLCTAAPSTAADHNCSQSAWKTYRCRFYRLTDVPANIPPDTTLVDLRNNLITVRVPDYAGSSQFNQYCNMPPNTPCKKFLTKMRISKVLIGVCNRSLRENNKFQKWKKNACLCLLPLRKSVNIRAIPSYTVIAKM